MFDIAYELLPSLQNKAPFYTMTLRLATRSVTYTLIVYTVQSHTPLLKLQVFTQLLASSLHEQHGGKSKEKENIRFFG